MRDSDYEFIRELVYTQSRINLGPDKKELVSARLGKRLRATNITSISDYCRFLQEKEGGEELAHLIDAISTNHTYFFRENEHFDFLTGTALPEMVKRRATERWSRCNVWSAASSSGEVANTSCPPFWRVSATAGLFSSATAALASRSTTSLGVPFGAAISCFVSSTKSG